MKSLYKVYLTYSEHRSGGDIYEGQEEYDFPDREDSYIDFTPKGLFTKQGQWQETIDVTFNPNKYVDKDIYLVVVRYETGDTFGCTYGAWSVTGAFSSLEEAELMRTIIEQDDEKVYDAAYKEHEVEWPNASSWPAWKGYFERLSSVEIYCITLRNCKASGMEFF
jgi:hypothetical protein